jgi:ParB family chromosome partitioning protein
MATLDTNMSAVNRIYEIPLEKIRTDPTQPRKFFSDQDIRELADSIKEHGLLQPIMVKKNSDGTFLIIHGERRFRAHQIATISTIKCIIADKTDAQVKDARIVENLVRADLSDMELAKEFQRRVDAGETHEQIAHSIKKSRTFVTQRLALMRLPEERKQQLEQGKITFADARVITASNNVGDPQHGYGVTMENSERFNLASLEVYRLFQSFRLVDYSIPKAALQLVHEAYHKDLATIRRALS